MEYESMIKKEKVEIDGRKFAISAIPCDASHQIWCDCIKSMGDKVNTFGFACLPQEIVARIMCYVAACVDGKWVMLDGEEELTAHVPDEYVLQQIVLAMCKKNFGFFFDGSLFLLLNLLEGGKESSGSSSDFRTKT